MSNATEDHYGEVLTRVLALVPFGVGMRVVSRVEVRGANQWGPKFAAVKLALAVIEWQVLATLSD